jgi:hypothetical protein
MIPDETDFISNIASTLASDILKNLKDASVYFEGNPNGGAMVATMHHHVVAVILTDFIQVMSTIMKMSPEQLMQELMEDVKDLIKLQVENG